MVNSGPHLTCVGQASQDVAAESVVERETLALGARWHPEDGRFTLWWTAT